MIRRLLNIPRRAEERIRALEVEQRERLSALGEFVATKVVVKPGAYTFRELLRLLAKARCRNDN
jgi:hypothetical protein